MLKDAICCLLTILVTDTYYNSQEIATDNLDPGNGACGDAQVMLNEDVCWCHICRNCDNPMISTIPSRLILSSPA